MSKIVVGRFGEKLDANQLLRETLGSVDDYRDIVIVAITKDDEIGVGWTYGLRAMSLVGLLEFAKTEIMESVTDYIEYEE